jgi:chemotaxis signal transduction protein
MAAEGSFCLFHCESLPFAVAVANVAEIAEVDALVRIGLCPPRIAGLCPYYRQVVPVVTLGQDPSRRARPTAEQRNSGKAAREVVLIVQTSQGIWGILIGREGTSITTQRPSRHEPKDEGDGVVTEGRIEHQGVVYSLLDAESTWHRLRALVVNWYALFNESIASPRPMGRAAV